MAYEQAAGVPMAVPVSWSQKVLANEKMLFVITVSSICRNRAVGKFSGIFSALTRIKSRIELRACCVSMLVYIETASAENSRASSGIC